MVLIQLLLPAIVTGASFDVEQAFTTTRGELVERFGGLTAYLRSPAKGAWTAADGRIERDDVVMIEVVAKGFEKSWWRDYTATLAARFRQQAIHVRAMSIELADDETA